MRRLILLILALEAGMAAFGAERKADELLERAQTAFKQGHRPEALDLATQAIAGDPNYAQAYYVRGRFYEALGQHRQAIADYDRLLKLAPDATGVYQRRGIEHFKAGQIEESIRDFDRFVSLVPSQAAHHWQRGIAYYYAGKFQAGRQQFELHQTVNSNDVENAVWHFLCVARAEGFDKARASLLKISGDSRVPMMQIYSLYKGAGSEDEVLAATRAGEPSSEELKQRQFYAHLYLGLFYEAQANAERAREYILKAAGEYAIDHYMGDVARVHLKLRDAQGETKAKE